jgi:hypothetical protein
VLGLCLLGIGGIAAFWSPVARANATITVGSGGCTLPAAIASAQSGTASGGCAKGDTHGLNTIVLPANSYKYHDLHVASGRISIVGHAASDTIIDGDAAGQILMIDAGATVALRRVTLQYGDSSGGPAGGDGVAGGAVFNAGTLTIAQSVLTQNQTGYGGTGANGPDGGGGGDGGDGGAVASSGRLTISDSTLSYNTTGFGGNGGAGEPPDGFGGEGGRGGSGGAVAIEGGHATIARSRLDHNGTGSGGAGGSPDGGGGFGGNGGAIALPIGSLTISSSTISGNTTGAGGAGGFYGPGGDGGGIDSEGALSATRDTLSGNGAGDGDQEGTGGGINSSADASMPARIVDSTIAGNVTPDGAGAGLQVDNGKVALVASTVAHNSSVGSSSSGSGIGIAAGYTLTEGDSLVASNGAANCTASGGTLTSLGHNLSFPDQTCAHEVAGDPKLGPLNANGGPTRTMAPAAGSPAINAGSAFGLTIDQRGFPRPYGFAPTGDGSDIGAFERQGPVFGAKTRVTLALGRRRIRAAGPLPIAISNANVFRVGGILSGRTAKRVAVSKNEAPHRIALTPKSFLVRAGGKTTVRLDLPQKLRALLKKDGKLTLVMKAKVSDPARRTRTVTKPVTPQLKK